MPTHARKQPEAEAETPVEAVAEAAPAVPADINVALAELAGVPVKTRDTPVGLYCQREDGRPWSPATDWNDAMLAAGRLDIKKLDVHPEAGPMGLCVEILRKKGK